MEKTIHMDIWFCLIAYSFLTVNRLSGLFLPIVCTKRFWVHQSSMLLPDHGETHLEVGLIQQRYVEKVQSVEYPDK